MSLKPMYYFYNFIIILTIKNVTLYIYNGTEIIFNELNCNSYDWHYLQIKTATLNKVLKWRVLRRVAYNHHIKLCGGQFYVVSGNRHTRILWHL